jgi:hypothetical protein
MRSGPAAYNGRVTIDAGAVMFALAVVIAIESWRRTR